MSIWTKPVTIMAIEKAPDVIALLQPKSACIDLKKTP
jgi:hypothetical protein